MIRKSKYGATKIIIDGIKFDSKKESEHYKKLKIWERNDVISRLKLQVKFPYIEFICLENDDDLLNSIEFKRKYIADFTYYDHNGKFTVVDVKGFKTAEYKKKKKIIEKLYNIIITEV